MDAPHLNEITLCLAYYENPEMLLRQLNHLADLPFDLKRSISLIVVDDGSPAAPAEEVFETSGRNGLRDYIGRVELFRMDVDIRWNQDACRNLAASQAKTKWLLLTDIDHIAPEPTWRRIIEGRLNWKTVYTFTRLSGPSQSPRKPHPNSWLLTRELYDAAGGYDERFAGYYGTDGDFKRRLLGVAKIEQLPLPLVEFTPEMVVDCRTVRYERKTAEDGAAIPRITAERARDKDPRPKRGLFPWRRLI